jgi:hypothetical protein
MGMPDKHSIAMRSGVERTYEGEGERRFVRWSPAGAPQEAKPCGKNRVLMALTLRQDVPLIRDRVPGQAPTAPQAFGAAWRGYRPCKRAHGSRR